MARRTRAFTLAELIVVIVAALLIAVVVVPLMIMSRPRVNYRWEKDMSQVRGILQGMAIWADSNKDQFPLPSTLDTNDATVPEQGPAKDTTANILALMIHNGYFPAELAVSPAEVGNVARDEDYEVVEPTAAVDPANALWDPSFSADFTAAVPGNTSYAHAAPIGPRRAHWGTATAEPTRAILANRGPQITSVALSRSRPTATLAKPNSNSLRIHGPADRWHGAIGYQDIHVDFDHDLTPGDARYTLASGAQALDTLFYDEPDDATGDNNYLTITIPASGVAGGEAIWD